MKQEFNFIIDENAYISIFVPNFPLKVNPYQKPGKKLQKFDVATIYYVTRSKKRMILEEDGLIDVVEFLQEALKKALANNLPLPDALEKGNVGIGLNKMLQRKNNINLRPFWIWSFNDVETLIYNADNKIYLEIAPTCPDIFADKSAKIINMLFQKFIKTYKPYLVSTISRQRAQKWLAQCEEIVKIIT